MFLGFNFTIKKSTSISKKVYAPKDFFKLLKKLAKENHITETKALDIILSWGLFIKKNINILELLNNKKKYQLPEVPRIPTQSVCKSKNFDFSSDAMGKIQINFGQMDFNESVTWCCMIFLQHHQLSKNGYEFYLKNNNQYFPFPFSEDWKQKKETS